MDHFFISYNRHDAEWAKWIAWVLEEAGYIRKKGNNYELTPRGTRNKFAYKGEYGVMELRRILRGGMVWPCDFGFIPQTLAGDGDYFAL